MVSQDLQVDIIRSCNSNILVLAMQTKRTLNKMETYIRILSTLSLLPLVKPHLTHQTISKVHTNPQTHLKDQKLVNTCAIQLSNKKIIKKVSQTFNNSKLQMRQKSKQLLLKPNNLCKPNLL